MGRGAFHLSSLASSIAVLALYACTDTGPDGAPQDDDALHGEVQQDIINGDVVRNNDHGVAMVLVGDSLCTGTMLNHFWVLTAKHCVDGAPQAGATVILNNVQRMSQAIAVHPSQDVALIILSSAMPINGLSSGVALPIFTGLDVDLLGDKLDCWGFGRNTFTGGSGTLRHAPIPVVFTTPETLEFIPANGQIQWEGDSGGTCFTRTGELRATGVNSFAITAGSLVLTSVQVGPEAYRDWLLMLPFNHGAPVVADFDGDHRSDLVFASDGDPGLVMYSAKLAPGAGSPRAVDRLPDGAPIWNEGPPLVGDFDGDGDDDLAFAWRSDNKLEIRTKRSNRDGTYAAETQAFPDGADLWNQGRPLVGDVDGDGRDDILFARLSGDHLEIRTKLSRSDGSGGITYLAVTQQLSGGEELWNQGPPLVGDFNGDSKTDVAFAFENANGKLQINTELSRGDGAYTEVITKFPDGADLWNRNRPLVGDVDGDGRDDIVFTWLASDDGGLQIRSKLARVSGGALTYTAVTQQFTDGVDLWYEGPPLIGDVDGDGDADLVFPSFRPAAGLQLHTKLSIGGGNWSSPAVQQLPADDFLWNRGGPKLIDSDGDGRADVVFPCERAGRLVIRIERSLGGGRYAQSEANL